MNRIEEIARIDNELRAAHALITELERNRKIHVLTEWENRGIYIGAVVAAAVHPTRWPTAEKPPEPKWYRIAEIEYESQRDPLKNPWVVGNPPKKSGEWSNQRILLFDNWHLEKPHE